MPDRELKKLFDQYWKESLEFSPSGATFQGIHKYDDRLEDLSRAAHRRYLTWIRGIERRLKRFKPARLTTQEAISREILLDSIERSNQFDRFPLATLAIDQMHGLHLGFLNLATVHPFQNRKGFQTYLARLDAFAGQLAQVQRRLAEGLRKKWTLPAWITEKVVSQLEDLASTDLNKSPFLIPPLKHVDALRPEEAPLLTRLAEKVEQVVVPALNRLARYMREKYLPRCRKTAGLCHLPRGGKAYELFVKKFTTLPMSAKQVHQAGLDEVKRIQTEMEAVKKKVGFRGKLAAFFEHVRGKKELHYKTRQEIVNHHRALLKKMASRLPQFFPTLPANSFEVQPMPAYQERDAPDAYYRRGNKKSGRPGVYFVNTYEPQTRGRYKAEVLAYHEAVPGHHLQITLAQELKNLPRFRTHGGVTAYVEGWALYTEKLAAEMGFYEDPYSEFGRLTFELKRACRLVVDTGLHALGWSREQAISYLTENTSLSQQNIEVEVDRYTVMPGQAISYKIGELFILSLRDRVKKKAGKSFDIKAFHQRLLENGAVPLRILEQRVLGSDSDVRFKAR